MPRFPIDDYEAELAAQDYAAKLPVELPEQLLGPNAANVANNLFAPVNGVPRYQTWPEVMVRNGASLPLESYQGKVPTNLGLRREDFTDIPQELKPSDTFIGKGMSRLGESGLGNILKLNPLTAGLGAISSSGLGTLEGSELGPSGELISRAQDLSGMAGGGSVVGVEKGAVGTLGGDLIRNEPKTDMLTMQRQHHQGIVRSDTAEPGAAIAALEHAPRFYSALENAVKDSKTKAASADQWLGELRNRPGVKQEEIDWVLHDLPKGQITKSELEQYVNSHKVELKEVTKGKFTDQEYNALRKREQELIAKEWEATPADRQEWADIQNKLSVKSDPKYSQYQFPGGENYREHLLTLPEKHNELQLLEQRYRQILNKYEREGQITPDEHAEWDKINARVGELRQSPEYRNHNMQGSEAPNSQQNFISSHWDNTPNVLAHIRTNERNIPNVGNSLHIEEIQSDWHQAGRKQGYKGEAEKLKPDFDKIEKKIIDSGDESVMSHPELKDALAEAIKKKIITADEAKTYARYVQIENTKARSPVLDAPFKTNWADLALKRIIRHAAETNRDAISWTPGEAQAARYDLSKQISKLEYDIEDGKLYGYDHGQKQVINERVEPTARALEEYIGKEPAEKLAKEIENHSKSKEYDRNQWSVEKNEETGRWEIYDPNGEVHYDYGGETKSFKTEKGANNYIDEILKEDADREGTHNPNISGLDLKVGGEGMKAFYDKMLVDKANAIAKKFGGKVETNNTKIKTPAVSRSNEFIPSELLDEMDTQNKGKENNQPVHVLRITPQLRDAALSKGFSLFADTGKVGAPLAALTRVEHNPFTADAYHGTPKDFQGSEIKPSEKWPGNSEFYSTPNSELANQYAGAEWYGGKQKLERKQQILPLKINTQDYHVVDAKNSRWDSVNDNAIWEANQLGKKGVVIKNVYDGSKELNTIYITLDPSTVRSKFAKFDPDKFHESGLMKASGLPIITDKDGKQLDHNLKPLTLDEQNALLNRNPLPTHEHEKPAVDLPSKHALALAAAKAAEYGIWAARPSLGMPLWAGSLTLGAALNAAPMRQRREGMPVGKYKLVPIKNAPDFGETK